MGNDFLSIGKDMLKKIFIGITIWSIIVLVCGVMIGYNLHVSAMAVTEEYASEIEKENSSLNAQILTITGKYDQMKADLEYYKSRAKVMDEYGSELAIENSKLSAKILSLEWEIDNLKRDLDLAKFREQNN